MPRLSVPALNMPDTIEGCVCQLRIFSYSWHLAMDANDFDFADLVSEIKTELWLQYKRLGGEAEQIGDLVRYGKEAVLKQIQEGKI